MSQKEHLEIKLGGEKESEEACSDSGSVSGEGRWLSLHHAAPMFYNLEKKSGWRETKRGGQVSSGLVDVRKLIEGQEMHGVTHTYTRTRQKNTGKLQNKIK